MLEKLKSWLMNDQIYLGAIVVVVALGSFALGRYTSLNVPLGNGGVAAVAMTYTTVASSTHTETDLSSSSRVATIKPLSSSETSITVVASKNGSKYHLPTCPGAKQIKPENKLTFPSEQAAQAAGYERAANCKTFPDPLP